MKGKALLSIILTSAALVFVVAAGFLLTKYGLFGFVMVMLFLIGLLLTFYIIRNPFYGFLMIIFFLPFERVPTIQLAGVDLKINIVLGFITLVAWILALIFNRKKWKVQPNVLTIPILTFVSALILSLLSAYDFSRGFQVLIFTIFTILLSILSTNMLSTENNLQKTVVVLFLSSLIVGIFGLFQFGGDVVGLPQSITLLKTGYTSVVFGFPRVQVFSMEPLFLANFLIIPISLLLAYFFGRVKIYKSSENISWIEKIVTNQWFIISLLTLLLIVFVLTVSRGGYLGLVFVLLIFAFVYWRKVFTWRNLLIVLVLGLVYWGVTFALSQSDYKAQQTFFGHVTLNDISNGESIEGRLIAYREALKVYDKYPILGIGLGNYGPYVKNFPPVTPKTGWPVVNNQYIELLAETGIVGFVSFLIIFIVLFVRSIMAARLTQNPFLKASLIGLSAALVGVLVQYNFFSTLYIIHIWVLIGMLVGVQNIIFKTITNHQETITKQ